MLLVASMRAWRLDPLPEIRMVALVVGGSCMLTGILMNGEDKFRQDILGCCKHFQFDTNFFMAGLAWRGWVGAVVIPTRELFDIIFQY